MPFTQDSATPNYLASRFVWFDNRHFIFIHNTAGGAGGCWRQAGPGAWAQVQAGTGNGQMWNNTLFQGVDDNQIFSSVNGVAWALDYTNAGLQPGFTTWLAIGGYGSYLYAANGFQNGADADIYFYRRDTLGAWVQLAPILTITGTSASTRYGDIIGFGNYIYYTPGVRMYRYDATGGWMLEPTIDGLLSGIKKTYMTVRDNVLWVSAGQVGGWYKTLTSDWTYTNFGLPDPTDWDFKGLSLGPDNYLYLLCRDRATLNTIRIQRGPSPWKAVYTGPKQFIGPAGQAENVATVDAVGTLWFNVHDASVPANGGMYMFVPGYACGAAGAGLSGQALDCDGDGEYLLVGAYNVATQPLLIKAPLPLPPPATGTLYNPAAGDAINVRCATTGEHFVISGYFGAGQQVRYANDGGLPSDCDPGTWAANRAQPLWIDDTEHIEVGLDALQDLYETENTGGTWTQRQAAVGYAPSAMARLAGGEELIIGNGAGNRIDYSPNRGITLTDITGAFVGNVAALEVV